MKLVLDDWLGMPGWNFIQTGWQRSPVSSDAENSCARDKRSGPIIHRG